MSTNINKVALPGIPDNKWDICQYNEIDYLPEVGSTPAYPGMICPVGGDLFLSGYFGENTDTLAWTHLNLNAGTTTTTTTTTSAPLVNYHVRVLNHYGDPLSADEQTKCSATIYDIYRMPIQSVQCESTSSLHFYQIGSTRIPSYIVVIYQGMSKTISNLNATTSTEYVADFSGDIEFVRYTYNLVPHVLYQGQEVRTYQIGQYADYNFDEVDWENRFTTDGMDVCDYDNISQQNGVDSFAVYEKHPNKVFIIPYGVPGMAESYGPIWIPEAAEDEHHFEIELDQEQSFAPDLP